MALLSLTTEGDAFLLNEEDIVRVYVINSITRIESSGTIKVRDVSESLATIDAVADSLISLTTNGTTFLLNSEKIRDVIAEGSGSIITYDFFGLQTIVVSETPTAINALIPSTGLTPKIYKALLTQSSPVVAQTSGTFAVGQIWTLTTYVGGDVLSTSNLFGGTGYTTTLSGDPTTTTGGGLGLTLILNATGGVIQSVVIDNPGTGYLVGDIITITTGNGDATVEVASVGGDDFSNMELLTGTVNTSGSTFRATSTTPTTWTNSSSLDYTGEPYVTSTDIDGVVNPFVNTLGDIGYTYAGQSDFTITSTALFTSESKVNVTFGESTSSPELDIVLYWSSTSELVFQYYNAGLAANDGDLYSMPILIEVWP